MFLEVRLGGQPIGHIDVGSNSARFAFSDDYLSDANRQVLGLQFEEDLLREWVGFNRLPSWFSNVLPEGQLRALVGSALHLPSENDSNVRTEADLLSVLGVDLPGAVSVVKIDVPSRDRQTFPVRESPLLGGDQPVEQALRFSVAGVGIKFSMLRGDRQFGAPAVGQSGDWLVKLPDRTFQGLPLNEFAVMSWAAAAGLDVPDIELIDRDQVLDVPDHVWGSERLAYAIRRFDRGPGGSRVHIEDLAQVRGIYPDAKYLGNFETVGALIFRGIDETSFVEFVARLAFVVAVGNDDAHFKNWSLRYSDGRIPRLAPLYDMVSAAPYDGLGLTRDLGLKLSGNRRYQRVSLSDFDRLAEKVGANVRGSEIAAATIERMAQTSPYFEEASRGDERLISAVRSHFNFMRSQLGV